MAMDISTRRKILETNMAVLQKKAAALKKKDVVLFAKQKMLQARFLQVMSSDIPTDPLKQTTRTIADWKEKTQGVARRSSCPESSCIDAPSQVKSCSKFARRRSLSPTMVSDKLDTQWEIRKNCSTSALDRLICVTGTLQRPKPSLNYAQRRTHAQKSVERTGSGSKQSESKTTYIPHHNMANRRVGSGYVDHQELTSSRRSSGYESDFVPNNVFRNEDDFVRNDGYIINDYRVILAPNKAYHDRGNVVLNNAKYEGQGDTKLNNVQSLRREFAPNMYRCENSRIYGSEGDLKYTKVVPSGFSQLLSSGAQCTWC